MSAVTYSDDHVADFLNQNDLVVPLMLPFNHQPLSDTYRLRWTPFLLVLDPRGRIGHKAVGFQKPEQLIPWILLGAAKLDFLEADWEKALNTLGRIYGDYPESFAAPESLYYRGICRYRSTEDPKHLKEAYETLRVGYPDSEWAMRTLPYRKIP